MKSKDIMKATLALMREINNIKDYNEFQCITNHRRFCDKKEYKPLISEMFPLYSAILKKTLGSEDIGTLLVMLKHRDSIDTGTATLKTATRQVSDILECKYSQKNS